MAMNTNAHPADRRAAAALGTVKKRMMTCGKPAVPIMREAVNAIMFSVLPQRVVVYYWKPRSTKIV